MNFLGHVGAYLLIGLIDVRKCFTAITFSGKRFNIFYYLVPNFTSPNFVKYKWGFYELKWQVTHRTQLHTRRGAPDCGKWDNDPHMEKRRLYYKGYIWQTRSRLMTSLKVMVLFLFYMDQTLKICGEA